MKARAIQRSQALRPGGRDGVSSMGTPRDERTVIAAQPAMSAVKPAKPRRQAWACAARGIDGSRASG